MSDFTLRPLDTRSQRELDHVCVFSLMTLWESRPELRIDPASLPNFGFDAHRRLLLAGGDRPTHRCLIVLDKEENIAGHSIVALKHTDDGTPYGFFWSRYILPRYRRQGLGRRFLTEALAWFESHGAAFAEVHVHVDNVPLLSLFTKEGFAVVDRRTEKWTYLVLRREWPGNGDQESR